jgi:hypothetical protein
MAAFGDFQTPAWLAARVCRLLGESMAAPASIVEPTCGVGNFLLAAVSRFPEAYRAIGVDINPHHIGRARQRADHQHAPRRIELAQGDFFQVDWPTLIRSLAEPILVIGNPPWVTNTHLSKLGSTNTPRKSNSTGLTGFEAISGKSNFDISEWMLSHLLEWLDGRNAVVAMLCKTTVARKVLAHAWRSGLRLKSANIHLIDSEEVFGASVDACLLSCALSPSGCCSTCAVYPTLSRSEPSNLIGFADGQLVANVEYYDRWRELAGEGPYRWRSGMKHDCSAVMELTAVDSGLVNGLREKVDIEDDFLFPLLKSSDIARNRLERPARRVLVTQSRVGADTSVIERVAPRTWEYLVRHGHRLDNRASSIYARQPRFAVFGVGDYTFAPWKVAISGLYGTLEFRVTRPFDGRPCVLDDTCYFIACRSKEEAEYVASLLNSRPAREFYSAIMFQDSKRPITAELLRRLDILALARLGGSESLLRKLSRERPQEAESVTDDPAPQLALFA